MDDAALVYYVNLFILSLLSVLVLVRSRRAIARLHAVSEWTSGIFLRNVYTRQMPPIQRNDSVRTVASSFQDFATDDSHSFYTHTTLQRSRRSIPTNYPPHVPSCPRFFRPLFLPFRNRVSEGFNLSQAVVQFLWFGILIFAALFSSPGLFIDPTRVSWVGTSQLPFLFAFSAKNNIISMLLGFGYEKLNFMHRFLGRVIVLAINIHAIDYFYKWTLAEDFVANISRPTSYWGLVGLICLDCLFFFSTSWWRRKAYNVFLSTHFIGYTLLFPALWFHNVALRPYVFACLVIIGFDRTLRVFKSRITRAKLRAIPELGVTRVECKNINAGWRAGQHVRLRVVGSGMGAFGWLAVHPFTISSVAAASGGNEGEGLVLMCKKTKNTGSWSNKLFDMAKNGAYGADYEKGDRQRNVQVVIEGPYGGPGLSMYASYSAVVLVVGGSGISYGLSIMKDLVQKDLLGQSRVKALEVVWAVQDPAALLPLIPVFTSLIRQSSPTTNSNSYTSLKISVFYTRAPIGKFPFSEDFFAPYHPKLTLSPGRPKVGQIIEGVMGKIVRLGAGVKDHEKNTGVAVAVCGPIEMADEVNDQVAKLDEGRRDRVGGVEVIEEVFGW